MNVREIVNRLLEDEEPDEGDLVRYSDAIAADEARGKVTYQAAQECDRFYHRTIRYKGRGKKPGGPYEARRNGATKTWRTRPGEFRVPIKIGYREFGYIDQNNADDWSTRPDFQEAWAEYAEQTRRAQQSSEIDALQKAPLKASPQGSLPLATENPKQPELFNEKHSRLRKLGVY